MVIDQRMQRVSREGTYMHFNIPLVFSMLLSLLPTGMTAHDAHYLAQEVIMLPTTGVAKVTSAPLQPYEIYRIQFSSPRDLADIAQGRVDVCLNGSPAKILDFETGLFDSVIHVYSLYQGTGDPLTIQLRPNPTFGPSRLETFAQRIPTMEVTISRRQWWQDHRDLGMRAEAIYAASALLSVAVLVYVRYRYGRDGLTRFLAQFTREARFFPPQDRRRAPGRVRVVERRDRTEGGLDEPRA
jgi:hypothetical protein